MTHIEPKGIQKALSHAQAFPILGPLFVSPVKALFSIAQLITGIFAAIFFGSLAIVTPKGMFNNMAFKSSKQAEMGLYGFIYSVSNFCTIGLVGFKIEQMSKP